MLWFVFPMYLHVWKWNHYKDFELLLWTQLYMEFMSNSKYFHCFSKCVNYLTNTAKNYQKHTCFEIPPAGICCQLDTWDWPVKVIHIKLGKPLIQFNSHLEISILCFEIQETVSHNCCLKVGRAPQCKWWRNAWECIIFCGTEVPIYIKQI